VSQALRIHQVEPALDPLHALFHAVQPPVDAGQPFLDMRDANLQIAHVIDQPINALFHAGEARLNLLQDGDDDVRNLAHVAMIFVLRLFRKCNCIMKVAS
jgi:hypothetical protein